VTRSLHVFPDQGDEKGRCWYGQHLKPRKGQEACFSRKTTSEKAPCHESGLLQHLADFFLEQRHELPPDLFPELGRD